MFWKHQHFFGLAAAVAAVLAGCASSPQQKETAFLKRGHALVAQKEYARAALEFQNAADAMPKDAEPYYQIGLSAWKPTTWSLLPLRSRKLPFSTRNTPARN
jgi:Flp pilus assembly protein TadD